MQFGSAVSYNATTACPNFPNINSNPTAADILASVTHPSTKLPPGAHIPPSLQQHLLAATLQQLMNPVTVHNALSRVRVV